MLHGNSRFGATALVEAAQEPAFLHHRIERYYRERVQETWGGRHVIWGRVPGPQSINLQSNDYLALSAHPLILGQQLECFQRHGATPVMSAVFLHETSAQRRLEQRIAAFVGAEDAVISQSGWCANIGLLQSIADAKTPVYLDMFAHMSLWEGARAAGAPQVSFFHNDPDHLEKQVQRNGPGIVVVDSVYSTNGSVCPLVDVVQVANRHGCAIIVDESHSLGTHGARGEGLVASLGLANKVHFVTASLAKAFAGRAGLITCSRHFHEYFRCESRPAIFSSALLPHEITRLDATLSVIEGARFRRQRLEINTRRLRSGLSELGYNVADGEAQIIGLEAGPEQQTMVLRDALEERDVFGSVFCAPATPRNRSLVRLSVHSALSEETVERVLEVCAEIRDEVGLVKWPSTRRAARARSNSEASTLLAA
jgi:CAI-1 autoinducer synthase